MSSRDKTGGPAFPRTGYFPNVDRSESVESFREKMPTMTEPENGMTLRDYFAAKALPALMRAGFAGDTDVTSFDDIAHDAYAFADAMLRAREQ